VSVNSKERILIRQAEISDLDFIIEAIIEADRSETDRISYCTIFNLSLVELQQILRNILTENVHGSEFCLSDFLVATVDDKIAGACCAWIESKDGNPSYLIKYSLLSQYLNEENITYSKKIAPYIQGLHIDRETLALQIESVYVNPIFRGLGLSSKIIQQQFKQHLSAYPDIKKSQLIVTKKNFSALHVYLKLGYSVVKEVEVDNNQVLSILPSNCLALMEKNF